jgi:uncharacterized membrane protein YdjX (TVP38/TMEM64 family)
MEELSNDEGSSFPWKWVTIGALIAGVGLLRAYLPIGEWLEQFNVWIVGFGPKGMLVYVGAYVIATVLFLPGSVLTIGAGFLFGVVRGTIVVSTGSTIGASLAFLISRYVARRWVAERAESNPRFEAIDRAIGMQGWKIVGLLRLSPAIPFNLSNYLYGLTSVRFLPYVIASWLGMLPGTVMYVYLGTAGKDRLDAAAGATARSWQQDALLGVGLVAIVAVTILITRSANNALAEMDLEGSSQA